MKKYSLPFIGIILIVLFSSCSPGSSDQSHRVSKKMDSLAVPQSELLRSVQVSPFEKQKSTFPETLSPAPPPPQINDQRAEGVLVYYCPRRMLENTDNNVSVTISKSTMQEAISNIGDKVAATTGKSAGSVQKDVDGSLITIAAKMKVELKFSEKNFEIVYKPEREDQRFDGIHDMNWDWIIRPGKLGPVQLTIVVSAFDEQNGNWIVARTPPKIIDIKVQVDPRGYFVKLWAYLENNPEWIIVTIIIPIVTYFYGRRQGKKKA